MWGGDKAKEKYQAKFLGLMIVLIRRWGRSAFLTSIIAVPLLSVLHIGVLFIRFLKGFCC